MDNKHVNEDDLFLLACGELDPARREAVEKAVANNPALAEKLEEFVQILQVVKKGDMTMASNDFNASLRAKLEWELQDVATVKHKPRRRLFPKLATAAAILIVAGLALFGILGHPGGAIAWADVVKAMDSIDQLHVSIFAMDSGEESHIELYYCHPDTWRVHGKDAVQFVTGDQMKVFDVRTKSFTENPSELRRRILPPDRLESLGKEGDRLLERLLQSFFGDHIPPGKPVLSTPDSLTPDIAVFDYAADPNRMWVRVWVARQSRLPIRVEAYSPKAENHSFLIFDYSDPQPAEFFDPDALDREVREKGLEKAHKIYRVGTRPVAGVRPRGRDQVEDSEREREVPVGQMQTVNDKYGIKTPTLLEILTAESGDILLVTRDPENPKPEPSHASQDWYYSGGHLISGFYDLYLWDNWGNVYIRVYRLTRKHGGGHRIEMTYSPIPPFTPGEGSHILTLTYSFKHGLSTELVGKGEVEIPPPSNKRGNNYIWANQQQKERVLRPFTRKATTIMEKADKLEAALAKEPNSVPLGLQMVEMLEGRGREEDAWKFFEERIKNDVIRDCFNNDGLSSVLGRYLFYLQKEGRLEEIENTLEQVEQTKKQAFSTLDKRRVEQINLEIERGTYGHYAAMRIPQAVKERQKGKKPRVVRVVRSRDGHVYLEFDQLGDHLGFDVDYEWGANQIGLDPESGYTMRYRRAMDGKVSLIAAGKGDEITVIFHPVLFMLGKKDGVKRSTVPRISWPITVQIPEPTEPTVDDMLQKHRPDIEWRPSLPPTAFLRIRQDAHALFQSSRYEEAMACYKEASEMPATAFGLTSTIAGGEERLRRGAQLGVAKCLVKLNRLDEAQSLLDRMEKDRLQSNLRDSVEGLEKIRHLNWGDSDEVYWMLRDARQSAKTPVDAEGRK